MTASYPSIDLLMSFNSSDLDARRALSADEFVWHFFNPKLPEIAGDYVGVEGLKSVFNAMGTRSNGSFHVEPVSVMPVGHEPVVVHVRATMYLDGAHVDTDGVVVWCVAEGRFADAWDIPAVFAVPTP